MKIFSLTDIRRGEFREVPEPGRPGKNEVLVRVVEVGVCGSDLHYYRTGRIGNQIIEFPFTVGHECSGWVVATGEEVSRVTVGDRIAVDPSVSCGECDQCRTGREHTCRSNQFLGCPGQLSGALSSYIVLPEACCFPMPPKLTWEQAVMSEPFAIAVYAASRFVDVKGRSVGILGSGPIGLCTLEAVKYYGARSVFATDLLDYRQKAAAAHHATWAGSPEALEEALEEREPDGLDVVIECCGSQEAVDQAFEVIRPGGTFLMVGIPEFDRLEIPIHLARRKEVGFLNVRRQVGCVEEAIRLIAEGHVDVEGMITHRFRFDQTREAFELVEAYQDGVIKAMIEFEDQG